MKFSPTNIIRIISSRHSPANNSQERNKKETVDNLIRVYPKNKKKKNEKPSQYIGQGGEEDIFLREMEASRRSRFQRASLALLLIRPWARRWSSLLAEFIGGFEESRRNFSRSVGIETRWLRLWERKGRGRERERGRGKGRVEVLGTVVLAHLHYPRPGPKGIRVYNGRTVLRLDQLAYQTSWYECAKNETKQSKDARSLDAILWKKSFSVPRRDTSSCPDFLYKKRYRGFDEDSCNFDYIE